LAASIQGAEHCAVGDPGGLLPRHRWRLRTSRHRYGPHPAMLAHQIDDAPSAIPLRMCLNVSAATSEGRNPPPGSTARMARSPLGVVASGAFRARGPALR
jgi:hypothetical protein